VPPHTLLTATRARFAISTGDGSPVPPAVDIRSTHQRRRHDELVLKRRRAAKTSLYSAAIDVRLNAFEVITAYVLFDNRKPVKPESACTEVKAEPSGTSLKGQAFNFETGQQRYPS
jgi:hypothetical protein